MERFFGFVRSDFLPEVEQSNIATLRELNICRAALLLDAVEEKQTCSECSRTYP